MTDFAQNCLHIQPKDDWKPQSGDRRAVPMTERVASMLRLRAGKYRWGFTAGPSVIFPEGGNQITERRLWATLKRVLRRLGIEGHRHAFRHGYISHALMSGVPEPVARSIVGHVDEKVIRLYTHTHTHTHIADQRKQEAAKVFDQSASSKSKGHSSQPESKGSFS